MQRDTLRSLLTWLAREHYEHEWCTSYKTRADAERMQRIYAVTKVSNTLRVEEIRGETEGVMYALEHKLGWDKAMPHLNLRYK